MRIDAHTSFLDREYEGYPSWKGKEKLKYPYLPSEFKHLVHSIRFDGVIAIQARDCLEETSWLLHLAEKYYIIKGVVGWIDIVSHAARQQLDSFVSNEYLKGIRYGIADKNDENILLSQAFQDGIRLLTEFQLPFDLLINERHLSHTIKLVEQHPDQKFVIDHLALPHNQEQMFEEWKKYMAILATFENVYCKISPTREELDLDLYLPYLEKLIEFFPSKRLMVGSNWPYYSIQANYETVMTFIFDFIRDLPRQDQANILGLTSLEFYQLNEPSNLFVDGRNRIGQLS